MTYESAVQKKTSQLDAIIIIITIIIIIIIIVIIIIIIIINIMSKYFDRIKVSALSKYIRVKNLLSTLALRKALK